MRWALLLMSGFLVCTPAPSPAAEGSPERGIFGPEATLADVDRIIDSGKRAMWQVTQILPQSVDRKGMEADLAEFVLSDAALTRIESLRNKLPAAVIAGSDRIDPTALAPLELLLQQESCKMAVVMMHWSRDVQMPQLHESFEAMLPRLPAARRDEFAAKLRQVRADEGNLRERLIGSVRSCESTSPGRNPVFLQRTRSVPQGYEELRLRLAAAIDAAVEAGEIPPLQQSRPESCPAPNPPKPGSTRAAVLRRGDPADYYPAAAVSAGLQGNVRVRIGIDRGGCVTVALIASTSGVQLLDEAAIRMAFAYEFIPAEENGQPRDSDYFVLPVNFAMKDLPGAQRDTAAQLQP